MNKDEFIRSLWLTPLSRHIEQELLQCIQCLHRVTFVNTL